MIKNCQESLVSGNNLLYHSLNELTRIRSLAARDQVEFYNSKLHPKPNFSFLKQILKTIKWMRLITGLRFGFLTLPTPYNYILGQITIRKTRITNDQELLRIISIK